MPKSRFWVGFGECVRVSLIPKSLFGLGEGEAVDSMKKMSVQTKASVECDACSSPNSSTSSSDDPVIKIGSLKARLFSATGGESMGESGLILWLNVNWMLPMCGQSTMGEKIRYDKWCGNLIYGKYIVQRHICKLITFLRSHLKLVSSKLGKLV